MKCIPIFVVLFLGCSGQARSQSTPATQQQSGNCSINNTGTQATVTITCTNVDPKLAAQIQDILKSSRQSEGDLKDIRKKLDHLLAGLPAASYGNLRQRCLDMAGVISKLADDRQALFDKFGKQNSFRMDDYTKIFQEANSQRLYGYLPDLEKLQKDLAQHNVIDVQFDRELKGIREWANEDGKFPQANNSYQTTVQYLRDLAILITKVANEVPQH